MFSEEEGEMKMLLNQRNIGVLFAFCLMMLVLPLFSFINERSSVNDDLNISHKILNKNGNSTIQGILNNIISMASLNGYEEAIKYCNKIGIRIDNDCVQVVVETTESSLVEQNIISTYFIENTIARFGGRVETSYRNQIQCWVPILALNELANTLFINLIRLPIRPKLLEYVSEGVHKIGADQWQNTTPYRTDSSISKICILDLGFKGYNSFLGIELPSSVVVKSFRSDNDIYADIQHGTACAEIVHDMAPNATLYLVNFDTDVEHHQAVDWIINQDINVISYSIGWYNAGAGDGTGPICEDVEKAYQNGIYWVCSAGNDADSHWEGYHVDSDNDGWLNFSGSDEILGFWVPAYTPVAAFLNWNDWGYWNHFSYTGSNQDYDLYLWYYYNGNWYFVDSSYGEQTGSQWPTEAIGSWYLPISTYWGVSIDKWYATKNNKLELFVWGNTNAIEYNVQQGSLLIPSDAQNAISVGATDLSNDALHYYSSRGPTHDGRIKPDFTAPSGVSTAVYGPYGFYGTSASAPHVAGAFPLMKEKTSYSIDQIKRMLESRAIDLGSTGKDNSYGIGRINLVKK